MLSCTDGRISIVLQNRKLFIIVDMDMLLGEYASIFQVDITITVEDTTGTLFQMINKTMIMHSLYLPE